MSLPATDQAATAASTSAHFARPNPTASLLLSHRPPAGKLVLVLGTGKLAASRCFACLEAGIRPVVLSVAASPANQACAEIQHRIDSAQALHHSIESNALSTVDSVEQCWNHILDTYDGEDNDIFAVCITDTLHSGDEPSASASTASRNKPSLEGDDELLGTAAPLTSYARAEIISRLCRKRRIPINVADKPNLCDFSFPASYRFPCTNPISPLDSTGDAMLQIGSTEVVSSSSLQIAVTTNGRGCRLAGRLRREIVSALPHNVGDAVEKVGIMRDLAKRQAEKPQDASGSAAATATVGASASSPLKRLKRNAARAGKDGTADVEEEDLSFDTTPLNSPVPQLVPKNPLESVTTNARLKQLQVEIQARHEQEAQQAEERTKRRMRWVAQISEYWPIEYLGNLAEQQMKDALRAHGEEQSAPVPPATTAVGADATQHSEGQDTNEPSSRGRSTAPRADQDASAEPSASLAQRARSQHSLDIRPPPPETARKGHIYLLGSGPGHPGLLTTMAYKLLTSASTDLILSDKLVPAAILRLIPQSTPLEIAKKFPGNAEGAQSELIAKALRAALEEGKTVVRLKQGDPFVYGRGGEEVLAFRRAGIECTVVPGISSSIAAPAMLGIPVTQRGAADSLVLCTGVGKGGKKVKLPGYDRGRSLIVLMGVARLAAVVATLTAGGSSGAVDADSIGDREGAVFPPYTPIAIIERASSSDQRMVASTLDGIVEAMENTGEQRPPGMMLIGWSVLSLEGDGDTTIQDDALTIESEQQLEAKDRERVQRWLKGRRWIVREGLDQSYRDALAAFHAAPLQLPAVALTHHQDEKAQVAGADGEDAERFSKRDESGWAPARYATGVPEGGWMAGEAPNRPATDELAYEQDKTYAEIQAKLRAV
ncbi:uroporphyrin III methyltransferase [Moesziomyces antarcticus T-34]|uniref:precorrin-2 dehydrogenase n=1 Tax=Pseudozyma antarctica (strain T-34) TaxID=1151754 RepID=M9LWV6_PSEA3|nr:uroporphyrin III methyltransferase [Moesziomyces antarcticus T-34]